MLWAVKPGYPLVGGAPVALLLHPKQMANGSLWLIRLRQWCQPHVERQLTWLPKSMFPGEVQNINTIF